MCHRRLNDIRFVCISFDVRLIVGEQIISSEEMRLSVQSVFIVPPWKGTTLCPSESQEVYVNCVRERFEEERFSLSSIGFARDSRGSTSRRRSSVSFSAIVELSWFLRKTSKACLLTCCTHLRLPSLTFESCESGWCAQKGPTKSCCRRGAKSF
jgi:hypothetical protein